MVAEVKTVSLVGINAHTIHIQVQITPGIASFQVVGLPDNAVKESRERIRGAFHALGIALPAKRITVSLSPADLQKEGNHFDLPIAIGLLVALKALPQDVAENALFMGELGLDGSLRPVLGVLPTTIHAQNTNFHKLFVPVENAQEGAWIEDVNTYGAQNLKEIIQHFKGEQALTPSKPTKQETQTTEYKDFQDVRGQESAKRAAEIAAAGGHNMLMCGPPGSGKSMIAERIPSITPTPSAEDILDISMIHSIAGTMPTEGIVTEKPFRAPHHTASAVALCGGGLKAKPGEMSLAHKGILFLDELPEFPRQVLETLRQPLETATITVSRANHHITYPSDFQLIAAMNPSPCGYLGHPNIPCTSTPKQIQNYRAKLSGPLLDRIDLHVDVQAISIQEMNLPPAKEGSQEIKNRVQAAYAKQIERYQGEKIQKNSQLYGKLLDKYCALDEDGQKIMLKASERYSMSARGYHRILRVARTIADLDGEGLIQTHHLAEALMYRYIPYSIHSK